jgi:hypothetical protein
LDTPPPAAGTAAGAPPLSMRTAQHAQQPTPPPGSAPHSMRSSRSLPQAPRPDLASRWGACCRCPVSWQTRGRAPSARRAPPTVRCWRVRRTPTPGMHAGGPAHRLGAPGRDWMRPLQVRAGRSQWSTCSVQLPG